VVAGGPEHILLVEHPPVITFGRRAGVERHMLASDEQLRSLRVEVVQSDRGGDITFHGPGQLVAYPIVRLNSHGLSVGGYVRALEQAAIAALAELGIPAQRDACMVGVWVGDGKGANTLAKICAIGVRIRRGVSLHGLALNVTTDLSYFNLIVPCGLHCRPVTSILQLLGSRAPSIELVKHVLSSRLSSSLAAAAVLAAQ
jgi:lipoyl(octanoyl) transferase